MKLKLRFRRHRKSAATSGPAPGQFRARDDKLRECCPTRSGESHFGTCPNSVMNTGEWRP